MNTKNSIVHFEIPADDVVRAQKFYGEIFGWKFHEFKMPSSSSTGGDPYYGVTTTPVDEKMQPTTPGAINGGLMKRKAKGQPFMNYINTDSIADTLMAIVEKGGEICLPKTEIAPGMGWIACFRDPEGNMMGLHEMPKTMPGK